MLTVTGTYNLSAGTLDTPYTSNSGTMNITGGTANLGDVTGTGVLNIGGDPGTAILAAFQQSSVVITSGSLTLTGGGSTNAVNSLTISGAGVLNLETTRLIIDYGSGSDPISTIYGYLKSGYNGGNWNGPGIISSNAQSLTNGLRYGIGWSDAKDKINGETIVTGLSSGQIEIKYTLLGDANLDGTVNGSDFSILAANFGQGYTNWDQGNFLFTPAVNGTDFAALAANFGQGDSGADVAVSQADIAALDSFAIANGLPLPTITAIPEPACLAMLAAAGLAAFPRRFRKNVRL